MKAVQRVGKVTYVGASLNSFSHPVRIVVRECSGVEGGAILCRRISGHGYEVVDTLVHDVDHQVHEGVDGEEDPGKHREDDA